MDHGRHIWLVLAAFAAIMECALNVTVGDDSLLKAARLNDLAAAKAALEKDPKAIDSRDNNQCTALHEAARYGDAEFVIYLIGKGADVNARAYNQFTPLHLTDDVEIAKVLIAAGADLEARDAFSRTPIGDAVDEKNLELIDLYLSRGTKLSFDQLVSLERTTDVAAILEERPWLAKAPRTCLQSAAQDGNIELVKLLLEHGADPNHSIDFSNASGVYSPFSSAVLANEFEIASLLAERGAEMDVAGGKMYESLFHQAVAERDLRFVKLMLEHGADANEVPPGFRPMTPLHVAANIGDADKCRLLLEFGAEIDAKTPDGATPIFFAAVWNHKQVCELLLARGAALDIWTACALGKTKEVKELLANDPDRANVLDQRLGRPPLFWAVQRGDPELVGKLLDAGADVNAHAPPYVEAANVVTGPEVFGNDKKKPGESALHLAAERGNLTILRQLLAAGAHVDAADKSNQTPLVRGINADHGDVVRELLDLGAPADTPEGEASPLAAAYDSLEITRVLLKEKPGSNSLQAALSRAAGQNAEVSKELLEHGAMADLFTACTLGLDERVAVFLDANPDWIDRPEAGYPRQRPLELAIQAGHVSTVRRSLSAGHNSRPNTNGRCFCVLRSMGDLKSPNCFSRKPTLMARIAWARVPCTLPRLATMSLWLNSSWITAPISRRRMFTVTHRCTIPPRTVLWTQPRSWWLPALPSTPGTNSERPHCIVLPKMGMSPW
jgi:ankyrin repeat protein